MSRYPSREVARFDQQFAETPTEKQERRDRHRIRVLEEALKHYTTCRHACIDCSCTKEAKAALY